MARRVSKRALKKKKPELELEVEDYQVPGEKRLYWQGVGGVIALFVFADYWVGFLGVWNEGNPGGALYHQWWALAVLPAFLVITWLVANVITLRPRNQRLKEEGLNARVLSKNYPKLKSILAKQSKLLSIDEPEMYVLDDDSPYMYSLPGKTGKIVTTKVLLNTLNDEEIAAMIAREMGHIKAGHPRMMMVTAGMQRANPATKVLLFPITAMALFLSGWVDLAEATADRMALLMTGRPSLLNAAIVKLEVAADREAEISQEELEAYLSAGSDISTDADQIERHFKMGEFLTQHPSVKERVEEIRLFLKTEEGQDAMEKLMEVRQKQA